MVTIGAVDYAFEDVPAEIEAGTQLSLTNTSTEELHELVAMRLPDEERRSAAELLTLPEEQLGAMFGNEPATVLIAPPGAEGMAVVGDGVLTEPGRYILLCGIPIGADPQEYMAAAQSGDGPPQVQGGPPHFATGMFAEIVVALTPRPISSPRSRPRRARCATAATAPSVDACACTEPGGRPPAVTDSATSSRASASAVLPPRRTTHVPAGPARTRCGFNPGAPARRRSRRPWQRDLDLVLVGGRGERPHEEPHRAAVRLGALHHAVAARAHLDHAVDTEQPPVGPVEIEPDEVPRAAGRHQSRRLHPPIRARIAAREVAERDRRAIPACRAQRPERRGVDARRAPEVDRARGCGQCVHGRRQPRREESLQLVERRRGARRHARPVRLDGDEHRRGDRERLVLVQHERCQLRTGAQHVAAARP